MVRDLWIGHAMGTRFAVCNGFCSQSHMAQGVITLKSSLRLTSFVQPLRLAQPKGQPP
jgi:hypothetical protein